MLFSYCYRVSQFDLQAPLTEPKRLEENFFFFCIPTHKKAMMCLLEKMHTLDKHTSGSRYRAVGLPFTVNSLAMCVT